MTAPEGFIRIFDKEFIAETLSEAVDIVEGINPKDDLRVPVLQSAIAMVGQMRQVGPGGIQIPQVRVEGGKFL